MPDACETFRHASLHIKSPTSTKLAYVQADRGVDGLYFPVFRYTAAIDFIHQPVQTCSTEHLNAEIPVLVVKAKSRLLTLTRWRHFVL